MNRFALMGTGATVLVIAGVAGYFGYERHVRQAQLRDLEIIAAKSMLDPAGSQFRSQVVTEGGALCAEMNSPNHLGGMTGFRRVIAYANGEAYLEGVGYVGPKRSVLESADDFQQHLRAESDHLDLVNDVNARTTDPRFKMPGDPETVRAAGIRKVFDERWDRLCGKR